MIATRILGVLATIALVITVIDLYQTPQASWSSRPEVTCEQGLPVHQFAVVNGETVNVRELPTVFSEVKTQVTEGTALVVVCQFGAWSQIITGDEAGERWISSGLITPDDHQPLSLQQRVRLILGAVLSLIVTVLAWARPALIGRIIRWILASGELPEYAKPLISNPKNGS